jgi:serine/threonine protein kinase
MHDLGVIHRDLKPANIMITPDEEPVITDFGMVNLLDPTPGLSTLTPAGTFVGTPAYMPPSRSWPSGSGFARRRICTAWA